MRVRFAATVLAAFVGGGAAVSLLTGPSEAQSLTSVHPPVCSVQEDARLVACDTGRPLRYSGSEHGGRWTR